MTTLEMGREAGGIVQRRGAYLTVKQFATELGLAEVTVRVWLGQRRIQFVRLGRAIRIPATELQRVVEEGTVEVRKGR